MTPAQLLEEIKSMDAQGVEELLGELAIYFKMEAPVLTNMDADSIATHLGKASELIGERTGN